MLQTTATQCRAAAPLCIHNLNLVPPLVQALVTSMRTANPGRVIPPTAVRGFSSRDAANLYTAANPETVRGGVFFERLAGSRIGFVLQVNMTFLNFHGKYQNPNTYLQVTSYSGCTIHESINQLPLCFSEHDFMGSSLRRDRA